MGNRLIILLILLVLVSCGTGRRLPRVVGQKDSVTMVINNTVTFRDSLFHIPLPREQGSAVLPDSDTSHLETSLAVSDAWVANGKLHHNLINRSDRTLPVILTIPTYVRSEMSDRLKDISRIVEVEKKLNWWQRSIMAAGYFFLGILVILFFIKIGKKFL